MQAISSNVCETLCEKGAVHTWVYPELDGLPQTIAEALAESDPHAAMAQMRLLLSLHGGILERSDDESFGENGSAPHVTLAFCNFHCKDI
jgi:hypothetical protein